MSRISCIIVFLSMCFCVNAQGIYTKVMKLDKFDDVVSEKIVKTLITKTDSTFIVETKGQKPIEYRYFDFPLFAIHNGGRDSLVNLVEDVYGFEDKYIAITEEARKKIHDEREKTIKNIPDSLELEERANMLMATDFLSTMDKLPTITVRTISKYRYIYEYDTDLFWIRFEDGSRLIYSKR